jgi:hypothetical protein
MQFQREQGQRWFLMQAIFSRRLAIPLCLMFASLVGCGKQIDRFAVSGKVTLDGKLVLKAVIAFEPVGSTQGSGAVCVIKDGMFDLKTEAGLHAGKYAVRISDEKPELDEFEENRFSGKAPIPRPTIPIAYAQRDVFEVTIDGPKSDLLFQMESRLNYR